METIRRIGKTDSQTRSRIVDAGEELMLQSGYASVTSRKVALQADVSSKLVHYYFRSMDDLFLEILARSMHSYRREMRRIAQSPHPLTDLWEMNSRGRKSALALQLMALATHSQPVKAALAEFGEYFRQAQVEIIRSHLADRGDKTGGLPAEVLAVTLESIARMLVFESTLDLSVGHRKTQETVRQFLENLERFPPPPAASEI